ncbi:MAG TPA: cobalt transporter CbiM [bacterium]|nr:cobalt transporter CbiM [bacterium]HOL46899.1 cobalt transporter CbiM [bacterium]HPQ18339.1 cobalt transporter CbiM [bacterium]
MHISEGVLSNKIIIISYILTIIFLIIGLKKTDYKKMPKVAVFSSAFFIASFIHIPIGPSSVHLILNGLIGIFLGWAAFPAIFVGLLFQAIMFQFGGWTTLGANTFNMAIPSILVYIFFKKIVISKNKFITLISGFFAGFLAVLLAGILVAISLYFSNENFINVIKIFLISHFPVMLVEGIITMFIINFIKQVKPELLLNEV